MVPDVVRPDPVDLGDAVRADRRQADGHVLHVPQIGAGVWVEFEQGDPDYPIWTGCFWGTRPRCRRWRSPASRRARTSCSRPRCRTRIVISDLPGPTGGIMLKSTTGATIIVNDTGIYIQNGKGASIVMTGPTVTVNNGALVVV